jgi:hypothetical protein
VAARVSIVVDASTARASGDAHATATSAIAARDALDALREAGLWLAFSEALFEEWANHQSTYARKWLTSMFARRHVIRLDPPDVPHLVKAIADIRDAGKRDATRKDLHLVTISLAASKRILSNDETARGYFSELCSTIALLKQVHWISPLHTGCCVWLADGAPVRHDLRLA